MPNADFHCHSIVSRDCCTTIPELLARCRRAGIDCLAVTDHNEIEGALRARAAADFRVIVGEEIFTAQGEVIGLFLRTRIPPGRPLRDTMHRIKDQGGLVYLPHPISGIRKSQLSRRTMEDHADLMDIVERYNARNLLVGDADAAWLDGFIERHGLAAAAASDAHSPWEVGNVRVQLGEFATPAELVARLRTARVESRPSPLWMRGVLNHRVRALLRTVKRHAA